MPTVLLLDMEYAIANTCTSSNSPKTMGKLRSAMIVSRCVGPLNNIAISSIVAFGELVSFFWLMVALGSSIVLSHYHLPTEFPLGIERKRGQQHLEALSSNNGNHTHGPN